MLKEETAKKIQAQLESNAELKDQFKQDPKATIRTLVDQDELSEEALAAISGSGLCNLFGC